MKEKIIELLVAIAHISAQLKNLSDELDRVYDIVGVQALIDAIKEENTK